MSNIVVANDEIDDREHMKERVRLIEEIEETLTKLKNDESKNE